MISGMGWKPFPFKMEYIYKIWHTSLEKSYLIC